MDVSVAFVTRPPVAEPGQPSRGPLRHQAVHSDPVAIRDALGRFNVLRPQQ